MSTTWLPTWLLEISFKELASAELIDARHNFSSYFYEPASTAKIAMVADWTS